MKPALKTLPMRRREFGALERATALRRCRFPRTVYRLTWDKGLKRWLIMVGKSVVDIAFTKDDAVYTAKANARELWHQHGIPCQVWVANKRTGQFSKAEATYGYDPRGSKG